MKIFTQNVFQRWSLEDKTVQAVITSPPYYFLRFYNIPDILIGGKTNCKHIFSISKHKAERRDDLPVEYEIGICSCCNCYKGQYGREITDFGYVEHTLLWINEVYRVLKDEGLFFLNIGDTFRNGKKLFVPHRIALAMTDRGWIGLNDIIWAKAASPTPQEHVRRFSTTYENIFMFAKTNNYYFDKDSIKTRIMTSKRSRAQAMKAFVGDASEDDKRSIGVNPGDVWLMDSQASKINHDAPYGENLVERMILSSTKPGDIVLDPFVGSGSTVRIAEKYGRIGYGIDLGYDEVRDNRIGNIQQVFIR